MREEFMKGIESSAWACAVKGLLEGRVWESEISKIVSQRRGTQTVAAMRAPSEAW